MKVKTSELTDAALDWAVLEAQKPKLKNPERAGIGSFGPLFGKGYKYPAWDLTKYDPSVNWSQGGPIIDNIQAMFMAHIDGGIISYLRKHGTSGPIGKGPTHLIAAMRCLVASRIGDEVDVPEELL